MKSPLKIALAAVAFAIGLAPFVQADDAPPPPPPPGEGPGGPGGPGPDGRRGGPRMDPMKMLDERVTLTEAQKEKIKPIYEEQRKELQALRQDESLSREDRWTKAREIMKKYAVQVREQLTPEQQVKFDKMLEEMANRRPGGQGRRDK